MFRKKLLLFISFMLFTGLIAHTSQTSASSPEQVVAIEETVQMSEAMLLEEFWPPLMTLPTDFWEITAGTWFAVGATGIMRQDDDTPQQINIATETWADIADGVIYSSMQLLTLPSSTLFPHGFLFRYSSVNNFYGAGFIDEDTLALGRVTCLPTGGYRT